MRNTTRLITRTGKVVSITTTVDTWLFVWIKASSGFRCVQVDIRDATEANFGRFFHALMEGGVYWPPSQFEAAFISIAHSDEDIRLTTEVAGKAFATLK